MKKNSPLIYIGVFGLLAIAICLLCFAGFNEGNVYFLNVAEAKASPDKLAQARLFGLVSPKELDKQANSVSFLLSDKDSAEQTIHVKYSGAIPDTLKAGAEVIVEGSMQPNGSFAAKTIMTKCPSKYQKENRQS